LPTNGDRIILESKMPVAKSTKQKSNFENVMTIDKNGETISNTQANITSTNGVEDGLEFSVMKRKSVIRRAPGARLYGFTFLPMAFLFGVGQKLAALGENLLAYGALGLFAITLLDSAFVPIPGGPDAAMIVLSAKNPGG